MISALENHINRYVELDSYLKEHLHAYFQPIEVRKKNNLTAEGKPCTANFFVVKGCLRMFFINDKGTEQTTQFAIENWWISDYLSFASQQPSEYTIQAVEDSEVLALEHPDHENLLRKFPEMERYFRLMHQRALGAAQHKIKVIRSSSREQLYLDFAKMFPEFMQRVPQYLIASYLGLTPEYVSEIRKKRS